jgi:hypothetical protein
MIEIVLIVLSAYMVMGLCFIIPFLIRGLNRVDPVTTHSTVGCRILAAPGMFMLWPILAWKWKHA